MVTKTKYLFIFLGIAYLLMTGCDATPYSPPYSPSRTIGGVYASDSDASYGYLAGGGDCKRGGNPEGEYCTAGISNTAVVLLFPSGKYEVHISNELNGCDAKKDYTNYGEITASGTFKRVQGDDEYPEYLHFFLDGKEAIFNYTSNYIGLSLCSFSGDPADVGLSEGYYPRLY